MTGRFYLALTPWLVFALADRSGGLRSPDAAALSSVVAVAVAGNDLRLRRRHPFPLVAAVLFAGFASAVGLAGDPAFVARFDRAIVLGLLAACLLGSLAHEPLTLAYARAAVSPSRAASERFRGHHERLTLGWAVAVVAICVSFTVGALTGGPMAATAFNWLVPSLLIVVVASRPAAAPPSAADEVAGALGVLDGFGSYAIGAALEDAVRVPRRLSVVARPAPESGRQVRARRRS